MSLGSRFFAATYDRLGAAVEKAGLSAHRHALLAGAGGRVIEIGAGTGANLGFYGDSVQQLTLTEPEEAMAKRLERRAKDHSLPIELVRASAEDLPFDDGYFDVAVSTLVLCSVDDQAQALQELRRVLKPSGRLLFAEHVRADDSRLAGWQDRLNWFNRFVGQGCNCNRATVEGIRAAGFTIAELERDKLHKVPPIIRPLAVGMAYPNGTPKG